MLRAKQKVPTEQRYQDRFHVLIDLILYKNIFQNFVHPHLFAKHIVSKHSYLQQRITIEQAIIYNKSDRLRMQ